MSSTHKEDDKRLSKNAIYCAGIATVLGSQFSLWPAGFSNGFLNFFISVILIGSGYVCLALCLAEITSAVSFSGGNYALARITLNKFWGFVLGACESIQYNFCVATAAASFGSIITEITGNSSDNEPLYWLGFYGAVIILLMVNDTRTYRFNFIGLLGAFVFVLVIIYCAAGPIIKSDFQQYSRTEPSFNGSEYDRSSGFFHCLPYASWMFMGLPMAQLSSSEVLQVNRTLVPKATLQITVVVMATAVGLLFSSASVEPGVLVLSTSLAPLAYGFETIFKISHDTAMIFPLIAKLSFAVGFMFAYSKQTRAMEKSLLLVNFAAENETRLANKFRVMMVGACGGFVTILCMWHWDTRFYGYLENVCLLAAFVSYIGIFSSYIVFRTKFSTLCQNHKSPFGVKGAIYGIIIFLFALIGVVGFQDDGGWSVGLFLILLAVYVVIYLLRLRHVQIYSPEEQSVFFIAYVVKANMERRVRQTAARDLKMKEDNLLKVQKKQLDHSSDHSSSMRITSEKSEMTGSVTDDAAFHAALRTSGDSEGNSYRLGAGGASPKKQRDMALTPERRSQDPAESSKNSSLLARILSSIGLGGKGSDGSTSGGKRSSHRAAGDDQSDHGSDDSSGRSREHPRAHCTPEDNTYIVELYAAILLRYQQSLENPFHQDSGSLL